MALDMEQLRKIFHVECRENLETLEGELLQLDPSQVDIEVLNTIFRAAHSIKGGPRVRSICMRSVSSPMLWKRILI